MQNEIVNKYTAKIMEAVKNGNKKEAETYKLIKAKLMEFVTQKNAPKLNEAEEVKILNKMIKERIDSANVYKNANRNDLAENEMQEVTIIEKLVPKAASEDEINACVKEYINSNGAISQKSMGLVIKYVKEKLKNVDGALAAKIVKSNIS